MNKSLTVVSSHGTEIVFDLDNGMKWSRGEDGRVTIENLDGLIAIVPIDWCVTGIERSKLTVISPDGEERQ